MIAYTSSHRLKDLPRLLRVAKRGFSHHDYPAAPKWIAYSSFADQVDELAADFDRAGLRQGDRLGLKGRNSPEWIAADLAALVMGIILVPIGDDMSMPDLDNLVETYDLQAVLLADPVAGSDWPDRSWLGRLGACDRLVRRPPVGARGEDDDTATLVFSSGTAGTRKCLAIHASGIEQTIRAMTEAWRIDERDNLLVALPLSGLQQRILIYTAIFADCQFSLADPIYLLKVMRQANPTVVVGPPSFYEPLEARWKAMPEATRQLAVQAGKDRSGGFAELPAAVQNLLETFGKQPRHLVVGSAPVRPALLQTYRLLGLPLYEVYGITEFGWVSFNTPEAFRDETVGRPLPGVRVELRPDGEIVLHGELPQCRRYVVSGEAEQHTTFLLSGGIATGDLGKLDSFAWLGARRTSSFLAAGTRSLPKRLKRGWSSTLTASVAWFCCPTMPIRCTPSSGRGTPRRSKCPRSHAQFWSSAGSGPAPNALFR